VASGKALIFGAGTMMENIMNGLPREALPSGLNVSVLLFYLFPPAWAYIANYILAHLIAFCGMFLLLRKHFLKDEDDFIYVLTVSVLFFLVPYYTTNGLTVAGQPLLAYAFLNVRSGQFRWQDCLIILLFPMWSSLALIAPFAIFILLLILAIDWIRLRRLNMAFPLSIALFALAYLVVNYQFIISFFHPNHWVFHRSVWDPLTRWGNLSLTSNFKDSLEMFLTTQYHTGSFWTAPTIVAAAACFIFLVQKKRQWGSLDMVAVLILLVSLEYGFYDWIVFFFGSFVPALISFDAARFYFLLPMLWCLLLGMCLKELRRNACSAVLIWSLVICQACAILKFNVEFKNNVRLLLGRPISEPTYQEFFAQNTFDEIGKFIGKPKQDYRVVSLGIHPSVSEYNGFYTLDAYLTVYPLFYKLQFREIIADELNKSESLTTLFDGWGNRCYFFSSELGYPAQYGDWEHRPGPQHLQINTKQLRRMGGEYVISGVLIGNSEKCGLHLEKHFGSTGSFGSIYLYSVL
jgi:hypothetical protein